MRVYRSAVLIALMILMAFTAGCEPKIYYFSFEDEGSFSNEEGTWSIMNPGLYSFGSYGVVLNDAMICAPHRYSGDFTITCRFAVDLGSGDTSLSIVLTPAPFFLGLIPDELLSVSFPPITADWTPFIVQEKGEDELKTLISAAIQGLDVHSTNTIKIIKAGNTVTFDLNGVIIAKRTLTLYGSRWSCISIYANTPSSSLWIRDLTVEYKGGQDEV